MKKMIFLVVLLILICLPAVAGCPTTAVCPEDGVSGNPTGQYRWQGSVEFAQFTHVLMNGGRHTWWERCN